MDCHLQILPFFRCTRLPPGAATTGKMGRRGTMTKVAGRVRILGTESINRGRDWTAGSLAIAIARQSPGPRPLLPPVNGHCTGNRTNCARSLGVACLGRQDSLKWLARQRWPEVVGSARRLEVMPAMAPHLQQDRRRWLTPCLGAGRPPSPAGRD